MSNPRRKSSSIRIIPILIVLVLMASSCSLLLPEEQEPLPPPLAEPPEPSYSYYTLERGDIVNQVEQSGIFMPVNETSLTFGNNSGRLTEFNAKMGDFVEKGQVLAMLDVGDLEHNLSQMEVDLEKQRLNYDKMMIGYNKLLSDIKDAKAKLAKAAKEDPADEAEAKEKLEGLERQKKERDIDLEIFELNLDQQESNLKRTEDRIKNAQLLSPIDGIIGFAEGLSIGNWVDTYSTVYTVVDPSELYLRLNSASVTGLLLGMEADVLVNEKVYEGEVVMTPTSTNEQAREQRLRNAIILSVEGLPDTVMPGDTATIRVILEEREDVLVLPRAGLRTYGSRNYVLVRDGDTNREIDIEVGMETATYLEVVSGIDEGDTIILR